MELLPVDRLCSDCDIRWLEDSELQGRCAQSIAKIRDALKAADAKDQETTTQAVIAATPIPRDQRIPEMMLCIARMASDPPCGGV